MIGSEAANKTDNNTVLPKKNGVNSGNWQLLFYFTLRKEIIKFCGYH